MVQGQRAVVAAGQSARPGPPSSPESSPGRATATRGASFQGVIPCLILAALLALCYYPVTLLTFRFILTSEDMAYGLFAPVVAAYFVWDRRQYLLHPSSAPSLWNLAFFVFGACLGIMASLAQSSTFSRFGLMCSLTGCLLLLGGWPLVRRLLFALVILFFTFPVPETLYAQITMPLQTLATRLAEVIFQLLGYSVLREGNVLQLSYMNLSVVEACSGLRSLITLIFFCAVYAQFFEARYWVRAVTIILAVPSAIAVNALRIAATGIMGRYNIAWTSGTYHEAIGWAAFLLGFLLVVAVQKLIVRALSYRYSGAMA